MKKIHEDEALLVIDKPAGKTIAELEKDLYPSKLPRAGIVHRLDKDTSGLLLIAKNNESLNSLQKQFKERKVEKEYLCLTIGKPEKEGKIETLIGRSSSNRKKQKVYLHSEPKKGRMREAVTFYKRIKEFKNYSLLKVKPITGRKHQIRCHLSYLNHPIVGDKVYGFKNQPCPKGLSRQFLHASFLKVDNKEFFSELPLDLKTILNKIK